MNKFYLGAAALILTAAAQPAAAADLVVKAPPRVAEVWTWTGWYGGVNGGYSWSRWNTDGTALLFPDGTGGLVGTSRPRVDGWLGGAQIGYNWQRNNWFWGIEADGQLTGERARAAGSTSVRIVEPGADFNDVFTTTTATKWSLPWFATFRGRLGLASENWLLYGTGGLAIADSKFAVAQTVTCQRFGPGSTGTTPAAGACTALGAPAQGTTGFSSSNTDVGFAIGAGVERRLGRNWSAKAEYLYLDFGSHTFQVTPTTFSRVRVHDNIFRVGLNYHWWDNTVVAKY